MIPNPHVITATLSPKLLTGIPFKQICQQQTRNKSIIQHNNLSNTTMAEGGRYNNKTRRTAPGIDVSRN